jgi:hypothetical protein
MVVTREMVALAHSVVRVRLVELEVREVLQVSVAHHMLEG